uniref:Leucine rich repeat containing 6 n=1 Tax=Soboliphyme baturini TaxID=241478 RepID=A0A183IT04_9BILA
LKQFCKTCRIASYGNEIKNLCTRLQEQSHYIEERRKSCTFNLKDPEMMKQFEEQVKCSADVPFLLYYSAFRKMKDRDSRIKLAVTNEELNRLQEERNQPEEDDFNCTPARKKKRSMKSPKLSRQQDRTLGKNSQFSADDDMLTELRLSDSE